MYTHKSLMSTGKADLIRIAIDNGGNTWDADGNRIKAVTKILALIKNNPANHGDNNESDTVSTATDNPATPDLATPAGESAAAPRRKYGHGQLGSVHWDKYRVSMSPKMYQTIGAPKDPWGDEMLPLDPAYFGAPADKALENSYIGDQEPVAPIVEKGPPKKRGRKPGFKAPAHLESAAQTDIEEAIAALTAEKQRRQSFLIP